MADDGGTNGSGWPRSRRCQQRNAFDQNDTLDKKATQQQGIYRPQSSEERRRPSNDSNPFINFKQFIDSTFRNLEDGLRHLPSNIAELKAKMKEEREQRVREDLDFERRWIGLDSLSNTEMTASQSDDEVRRHIAGRMDSEAQKQALPFALQLLRRARDLNKDVPVQKIVELYKDDYWWSGLGDLDRFASPMLSLGGACYYMPETGDNLPSTMSWRWSSPHHKWLSIEWFKKSLYSPINLEHHEDLGAQGTKWRAAFEDLMSASLDKPMKSQTAQYQYGQRTESHQSHSLYSAPGLDWMLSLQCRGILPPQLPGMWQHRFGPPIKQSLDDLDKDNGGILGQWPRGEFRQLVDEIATPDVKRTLHSRSSAEETQDLGVSAAYQKHLQELQEMKERASVVSETPEIPGDEQELYERYPFADTEADEEQHNEDVEEMRSHWGMPGFGIPAVLKEIEDMEREYQDTQSSEPQRQTDEELSWSRLIELAQAAQAKQEKERAETPEPAKPNKPDILSSLTTTQTTRMPDGTVTTKVVMKQRFADGREETSESVHTNREAQQQPAQQEQSKPAPNQQPQTGDKTNGGWFWR